MTKIVHARGHSSAYNTALNAQQKKSKAHLDGKMVNAIFAFEERIYKSRDNFSSLLKIDSDLRKLFGTLCITTKHTRGLQQVSLLGRAPSAALRSKSSMEKKIQKIFDKIKHRVVENYDNQCLFHIFKENARIVLSKLEWNRAYLSEILQNIELLGKNVGIVKEVIQKQNGPYDPRIQEQIEEVTSRLADLKITLAPIQNEMHKEHIECKKELKRIIKDEAWACKDSKEKKLWKKVAQKIEQSFEKALKESIFSNK